MNTAEKIPLFESVSDDHCKLLKRGRIPNGEKIIEYLNYKKKDVSIAAGIPLASVRYDAKMPEELRKRLIEWATAINLVGNYFRNSEKTVLWFEVPNPLLGGIAPRDMIRIGRFKKLLKFIQTALDENRR